MVGGCAAVTCVYRTAFVRVDRSVEGCIWYFVCVSCEILRGNLAFLAAWARVVVDARRFYLSWADLLPESTWRHHTHRPAPRLGAGGSPSRECARQNAAQRRESGLSRGGGTVV